MNTPKLKGPDSIESSVARVAIDTTAFVAADSVMAPQGALRDPNAYLAFGEIVNAFCNGAELYYPVAADRLCAVPKLLSYWKDEYGGQEVRRLALTPTGTHYIGKNLSSGFCEYARGSADVISRWLSFWWTQPAVLQRSTEEQIGPLEEAAEAIGPLLGGALAPLAANLARAREAGTLQTPIALVHLIGRTFNSFDHLAVAYVFSYYVRGWRYAHGIAEHQDAPIYVHHWLRSCALRDRSIGKQTGRVELPNVWFPWGTLLAAMYMADGRALDPERTLATLKHIRENGPTVVRALEEHREKHPQFLDEFSSTLQEPQFLLLSLLESCDVFPRYADTSRPERWALVLKAVAPAGGLFAKMAADVIASSLQASFFRAAESRFRQDFRCSTFWSVFDRTAINRALIAWRGLAP